MLVLGARFSTSCVEQIEASRRTFSPPIVRSFGRHGWFFTVAVTSQVHTHTHVRQIDDVLLLNFFCDSVSQRLTDRQTLAYLHAPTRMAFHESAEKGDVVNSFRIAIVYGSLWAIGSSWATAIRETVIALVPEDSDNQVMAELGSAALATVLGVGVSILATRKCSGSRPSPDSSRAKVEVGSKATKSLSQTLASRR